jgi:hypothetical protein
MAKKLSATDIEKAAMKKVRKSFRKAARQGHKEISTAFLDVSAIIARKPILISNVKFIHYGPFDCLQILQKGAKGEFERVLTRNSSHITGLPVWDEYLQSLKKRDNAPGCAVRTRKEMYNLIAQNGPKKMQHRLERYIERRIKSALEGCKI